MYTGIITLPIVKLAKENDPCDTTHCPTDAVKEKNLIQNVDFDMNLSRRLKRFQNNLCNTEILTCEILT